MDDVFSTYTYTGTGSAQTINNGINLSGSGGMVWIKTRTGNLFDHALIDTVRGNNKYLASNSLAAQGTDNSFIPSFTATGYTLDPSNSQTNYTGNTYISWTFRKAPKFFDIVTYTGNGVAGRQIPHNLGTTPGMVIVKRTSAGDHWKVWHTGLSAGNTITLNSTAAQSTSNNAVIFGNGTTYVNPTSSVFTVGNDSQVNLNGDTYVAYLFAHDATANGVIQCGSYVGDNITDPSVTLGWEPQFVMVKITSGSDHWWMFDTAREMSVTNSRYCYANTSDTEGNATVPMVTPNATGFTLRHGSSGVGASGNYIYIAIRRPNKPPTLGTQVYTPVIYTGDLVNQRLIPIGLAPDLWLSKRKERSGDGTLVFDRQRGFDYGLALAPYGSFSSGTSNENFVGYLTGRKMGMYDMMLSGGAGGNESGGQYSNHFFKRAPGVFDIVCYTGNGSTNQTISHSLTATPELVIIKKRSSSGRWNVISNNTNYGIMNDTNSFSPDSTISASTSSFLAVLGAGDGLNANTATYVAYLFATKAGISKVGSYTGNGTNQTINCGFTTGARFILIKRTDSTGDWYVWDTTRGIVAGNDPHLSLNTTAAEVTTDDSIDTDNSGFVVNQLAATNINVNAGTYIFLALA